MGFSVFASLLSLAATAGAQHPGWVFIETYQDDDCSGDLNSTYYWPTDTCYHTMLADCSTSGSVTWTYFSDDTCATMVYAPWSETEGNCNDGQKFQCTGTAPGMMYMEFSGASCQDANLMHVEYFLLDSCTLDEGMYSKYSASSGVATLTMHTDDACSTASVGSMSFNIGECYDDTGYSYMVSLSTGTTTPAATTEAPTVAPTSAPTAAPTTAGGTTVTVATTTAAAAPTPTPTPAPTASSNTTTDSEESADGAWQLAPHAVLAWALLFLSLSRA